MPETTIPGMFTRTDHQGNDVISALLGDYPIILVAPHADPLDPPAALQQFGPRVKDRATPPDPFATGGFNANFDTGTRHIAIGTANRLIQLGIKPYVLINRVHRRFVDMARSWNTQHHWERTLSEGGVQQTTPADIDRAQPQFRADYHSQFFDVLDLMVKRVAPFSGWLFELHGEEDDPAVPDHIALTTTRCWMARADFMYQNGEKSLFQHLTRQQFHPKPLSGTASDESDGVNFISGVLYGATNPFHLPFGRPRPTYPGVVTPDAGRLHAVHMEMARSIRDDSALEGEALIAFREQTGSRIAEAIAGFLRDNNFF